MLKDIISVYFLAQTAVLIWFFSPLKSSLISLITNNKSNSSDDFDIFLMSKSQLLGKLFSCTFCFTFWASVILSFILINGSLLDIILSTCVSITLNYVVLKYLENK